MRLTSIATKRVFEISRSCHTARPPHRPMWSASERRSRASFRPQGVFRPHQFAGSEMVPAPCQEQKCLQHLIGMATQGDQELSVRTVLCLKPISDGTLVRTSQGDHRLYRRMRVVELAVQ